jgi:multiple sugar transport system substrate-binding protein
MLKTKWAFSCAVTAALTFAASCASAADVSYALWDANQLPAYRQCAADFHKKNPDINIKITQTGWSDYWSTLSTGFVSGTAPDVFTDHLSKYTEFAKSDQIVDLTPYIKRDKFDTGVFEPNLYDIWGREGKQYGMPKDWDTIAMIVNLDAAKKAGVTLADLQSMTWNPRDGGSFEQVMKKLTVDTHGANALDPKFDKQKVAMYGYQNASNGDMTGQTQWSFFAVSDGFRFQDKPWAQKYYYDDPKLAATLTWLAGLPRQGVSGSYADAKTLGVDAMFVARRVAVVTEGSWMINYFRQNAHFDTAWVPLPVGPSGTRATMFNGLGDSIWAGSKVKEQAWKWVKYLGSADCQGVVAAQGVVFPSIKGMAKKAVEAQKAKGIDSSAFLTMSKAKTFLPPIGDNAAQVNQVITDAVESVLIGKSDAPSAMKTANATANQLVKN